MKVFGTQEEQVAFRKQQALVLISQKRSRRKQILQELIDEGYCGDLETVRDAMDSPFCPCTNPQ